MEKKINAVWEIDVTAANVRLTDGGHCIISVINPAWRQVLCHVAQTPDAPAIAALLDRAVGEWGLPAALRSDHGRAFSAAEVTRALKRLGIRQELFQPHGPRPTGHLEKFGARLKRALTGFSGDSRALQAAIEVWLGMMAGGFQQPGFAGIKTF